MKALITSIFTSLMLLAAGVAQAAVVMTDGTSVVYNPEETYIISGELGSDPFSIGFTLINPLHSYTIHLAMPEDMPGVTYWALSAGKDAAGQLYGGDALLAGESADVQIGPGSTNTPTNPGTVWFSMANYDLPSPIAFGPSVTGDIFDVPVVAVPEPSAWALLLVGLGLVGMMARQQQNRKVLCNNDVT